MINWKKHISVTAACLLTGILLAWAVQAQTIASSESDDKTKTLIDIIDNLETETKSLEDSIGTIRQQIETLQHQNAGEQEVADLQKQVQHLSLLAGQSDVSGPGIKITLDDNNSGAEAAKLNNPAAFDPEEYIVHDKNILYLVNSLRREAEAIAVNGQRLVPTSDIRCVGTVIMVNSTRLAPPFEITVIGDPALLQVAVQNSDEYIYLQSREIPVIIESLNSLSIPAYKGSNILKYAHPLKEGE